MQQHAGTLDPATRARLDQLIHSTLNELELDFERVEEGAFLVTLTGEHKLSTMTWLVVQDFSVLIEAFFMRKPAENEGGTYKFLLGRNARTYGVHFSVDRIGDVYLTGRVSPSSVTADELDRLLGCVRTYADETFDPAIGLGFAEAIKREQAWRAKLAHDGAGRRPDGVTPLEPQVHGRR